MRPHGKTLLISLLALCAAFATVAAGAAARAQDRPHPAPQRRVSPEGRALLTRWGEALHLPQSSPATTLEASVFGRRHVMFGRGPFIADLRWTREHGLAVEARVPWALVAELPPEAAAAARRGFSQWTRKLLAPVMESPLRRAADYHVEVASEDGTRVVLLTPWAPAARYESVRFYFLEENGLCERRVAVRRVAPGSPAAKLEAGAEILTSYLYRPSGVRNLLTETRTVTSFGETVVQYGYDDEARTPAAAGAPPQPVRVTVRSAATGSPIDLTVGRWIVDGEPFTQGLDELIDEFREGLRPALPIRGRVTLPGGAPAAGAAIRAFEPTPPPAPAEASAPREDLDLIAHVIYGDPRDWTRPRPLAAWRAAPQGGATPRGARKVAAATADADGRFEIALPREVSGTSLIVRARAARGTATVFDAHDGEVLDIVVGALMRAPGRLLDPGGKPVSNATIVLSDGVEDWTATTDDAGTFAIDGVAPGRYALRARADGYTPLLHERVLVRADGELDVRLRRGATLTVRAVLETDGGSEPLEGVEVVALETGSLVYVRSRTGRDGTCTLHGLPPGTYEVNGRSAVAASFGEELTNLGGTAPAQDVELLFEPFVGTPLTVVDAAGRPVEGMVFYCANADEEYDAELSRRLPGATDATGRYTFAFEFEGPHALIYGQHEGLGLVRVFPDAHDTAEPLTVRAGPAMRVFGTVRRPDGRPRPGARVLLEANAGTGEDELLIALRCGPDGSFEYAFTPRGEAWVSAELGDDAWSDDYTVTPIPGQDEYRVEIEIADWR